MPCPDPARRSKSAYHFPARVLSFEQPSGAFGPVFAMFPPMADDKMLEEERLLVTRLEALDAKLKQIRADLAIVKHAVGVLLTRLS